ncbi:MAG: amidohydrolase/deacetylase family metallohydrolase [Geminicoccaceae bacterium]|nr:amidohydrolase/deacetylase family metallohydrolase [Geminicoccaceae bacterium]MCS7266623.1 amidohydrolase/deacetylase family metallohydrolase [Geminicoccaceae bacterium]MCX7629247.1 amidohydrolase/deacetylase family metallohydrolase [Geminicoccaceae bacterium]MDW8123256.1 amidohydrolase/deacetylase family metallohydrolase [Geminicoccaceae bacterium]MDW8340443.1 amidohydrolase/deacetylase family metallohydrolase [Geminicoccaceae bacterium]
MRRFDLVLRGGRVIDPGTGRDEIADVAFLDGKVAAVGAEAAAGSGAVERRVDGCIVTPGLLDFHAHVYWGGTSLGVEADALSRRSGTTTWVDAGSAGPGNFAGFRKHVIERSETRILAFLHVSFAGIFAFSEDVMVGESTDLRLLVPEACARVAREHSDLVKGVKVRIGAIASGTNGLAPLHLAIEAADRAGLPVMCHIDRPPPRYVEVLELLRPGDVLTHCFKPFPNAPCWADGRVREEVWKAREKGVLFDVAHGKGSFSFATARAMLAAGFWPDVISSDVHALCVDGPAFDNLETMSKFLCLGMPLTEIVRAATATPARILGRPDLADLSVGSTGDATVLRIVEGEHLFRDVLGETMTGDRRFVLDSVVLAGRLWHVAEPART